MNVDNDVHEVLAHPDRPDIVVAAAAVGLLRSHDSGATWTIETAGLTSTYSRCRPTLLTLAWTHMDRAWVPN